MPTVRPARPDDAEAVAALSEVLGYPLAPDECRARIERLTASGHAIQVAEIGGAVSAWIEVAAFESMTSAPFGLIVGLVVDPKLRKLGLGRTLVAAAETWARERGLETLRVRSRLERPEAHEFYRCLGFEPVKEQALYARTLSPR